MEPENLKIRLYRALAGKTQVEMAGKIDVDPSTYGSYETGQLKPGPDKLERAARVLGVGDEFGDEVLDLLELRRLKRLRPGRGIEDLLDEQAEELRNRMRRAYERLLALPRPDQTP